ncbi:MAG: hypothetical protein KBB32_01340 [Spirochaetia bacterium]|nr:hypothetical protein [Spirochaetia bacterium]
MLIRSRLYHGDAPGYKNGPDLNPRQAAGHTGYMELYTLNLGRHIHGRPIDPATPAELLALADSSPEGASFTAAWDADRLIHEGDDGPRVPRPLPEPRMAADCSGDSDDVVLESGAWLFCQGRASGPDGMADILEWLVRELWWSGERTEGPLIVRLVREDGKTAVQALRRKVSPRA